MAAKSLSSLSHISIFRLRPTLSRTLPSLSPLSTLPRTSLHVSHFLRPFSVTTTLYPLQYEMIVSHPVSSSHPKNCLPPPRISNPDSDNFPEPESPEKPDADLSLDGWVDQKQARDGPRSGIGEMDRTKRKYYSKRRKRMYGSDSDDGSGSQGGSVELNPQIVEFNSLQEREEALFLHDTFAYPWEKDKHYRMVHELEKKYYPNQSLDNAFLPPGESNKDANENTIKGRVKKLASRFGGRRSESEVGDEVDNKGLIFFEEKCKKELAKDTSGGGNVTGNVMKKKANEPFKKVPSEHNQRSGGEPYLLTRNKKLPPRWDSPFGTVVLVNKPKGWTSFTVCGKLRRLVNVQKVGHAGTLDPMATGLLIVCVGKATKLADKYQGMIKGYSGVFRLGEATSTWDADSPVIQRESWEHIKDDDIKTAVSSFLGDIWQVPPMFSAIKVKGEKMYDKARRGESIELAPRRISILQFDIERSPDDRQDLIFQVICSKGTYIRSLCADLGKALGSCAHLTALRRDSIGEYSAENAWEFSELEEAIRKQ